MTDKEHALIMMMFTRQTLYIETRGSFALCPNDTDILD